MRPPRRLSANTSMRSDVYMNILNIEFDNHLMHTIIFNSDSQEILIKSSVKIQFETG